MADLKQFPGNAKTDDFRQAVRDMRAQLQDQIEFHKMIAKIQRQKYLALLDEGFLPAEALELTKKVF